MRLALLGSPVDQALSPVLHRAAYQALSLNWTYEAIDCREADLPGFFASLDDTWAGFSLTMPLKHAALPLMADASPVAAATGVVNTVVVQDGRLLGDNTDVAGMLQALREMPGNRPGPAAVLGAGSTAATALAALTELGIKEVVAVARNPARAGALRAAAKRLGTDLAIQPWHTERLPPAALVISALPPGAADALVPAMAGFHGALLDVVYRPWPTRLAAAARTAGATVVGGLTMLLHQAARQVTLQTGAVHAPTAAMREAALESLNDRTVQPI
ncbi:shikimate dehydrogenase [Peterkaempfera bronchialis]|uniref:Shikimate dehydrogenase n=1 Tax=Peterkaempfera bronchialis TaxID=2126346 RepID=A0A345SUA3_9ACTN|nr:shikimate dehydrogenase [Peterkaempfera bronchialis]AXI77308.1 shikimate dehydrogenase [Peterkaempfera bronchialis]